MTMSRRIRVGRARNVVDVREAVGLVAVPAFASAQLRGLEGGQWQFLGGDAGSTRSSPHLTQIDASNFADLQVAWTWRSDNYGSAPEFTMRATPVYADGLLYTVAGGRRHVVAIDPSTGETIWTFREPETMRYLRSPRADFGKGVAYAQVDGRGVIFITSPAYFLWALDAKTGLPLESWGRPTGIPSFSPTGVVDLIPTLVGDLGRWQEYTRSGGTYDPDHGIPQEIGMVTSSSPPIVVNGVVVVRVWHKLPRFTGTTRPCTKKTTSRSKEMKLPLAPSETPAPRKDCSGKRSMRPVFYRYPWSSPYGTTGMASPFPKNTRPPKKVFPRY
jgi:quinoprotein glucose dehydrogenase